MRKLSLKAEQELAAFIATFYADPLGFVMAVFPWGQDFIFDDEGNEIRNPLADKKGPEPWQVELLEDMGKHIRDNAELTQMDLDPMIFRSSIASGHGVGKSAVVSWLIIFLMATRVDTRGAVTASTQNQLEDKTWPELAKWHNLALVKHWFVWTATTYSFAPYPEDRRKNYRTTAASVSKDNTEAFAGLHNEGRTVFVIFDEASGVPAKIWEVAEGALTDGEGFFFAFGNPTQPQGAFPDTFDKHAAMYRTRHIDSREVSFTNKNQLADIVRKYGIDSDEVKVRVRGMFPEQSFNGFMLRGPVQEAMLREVHYDSGAGLIMAIDVARFGDDRTVFGYRQGRDARSRPFKTFKGLSTTRVAELAINEINREKPDAVVIESTGPGAGVIDTLRDRGYRVHEVHPGSQAVEYDLYVNKRAEMWATMRDALYDEQLVLPNDPELLEELTTIMYTLDRHEQKILLEAKREMKKRGLNSPDKADTLALTFAVKIARRDRNRAFLQQQATAAHDDNPLGF